MAPYDRFQTIGWNIKAIAALVVIFLSWLYLPLGVIGFIGFLYLCLLLHMPDRQMPDKASGVTLSPIDGRITSLSCHENHVIIDMMAHMTSSQIIFAPQSGVIDDKLWIDGAYINSDTAHFEMLAARQEWLITTDDGDQIGLIQYTSPQTRYVTGALTVGQKITIAEPFALGLLRSHIRLRLPKDYQLEVYEGQSIIAGETIIARANHTASS